MRWFWWFIGLLFVLSYADVLAFYFMPTIADDGSITPYFCPQDLCEDVLVSYLSSAQKDISCAFFDVDLDSVLSVLDEKLSEGVAVRLVVDAENYFGERPYLVYDTSAQFMHHKFCVVDSTYVLTGSMNPTQRGVAVNANNLVVFFSPVLAFSFLSEFTELWRGDFGAGSQTYISSVVVNGTPVDVLFCPEDSCEKKVVSVLDSAQESIYFMTFSFTSDAIGDMLLEKSSSISVTGLFDHVDKGSEYDRLSSFSSLYTGSGKLHHKVFIIDERIVVFGSYNPTHRGGYVNDEVVLIVDDATFAQVFLDEYLSKR